MRTGLCILPLALAFTASHSIQAQMLPRWDADVTAGSNNVAGDGVNSPRSGWDVAVGVGARIKRSVMASLVTVTTVHVARASGDFSIACPAVPGALCPEPVAVLPLADALIGAEFVRKDAGVRLLGGGSVHRTDAQTSDWMWGPQFRADVTVPATSRVAGVVAFRYSLMTEGIGNRIYVQAFSAGVRVH